MYSMALQKECIDVCHCRGGRKPPKAKAEPELEDIDEVGVAAAREDDESDDESDGLTSSLIIVIMASSCETACQIGRDTDSPACRRAAARRPAPTACATTVADGTA